MKGGLRSRLRLRHKVAIILALAALLPVFGAAIIAIRLVQHNLHDTIRAQADQTRRLAADLWKRRVDDLPPEAKIEIDSSYARSFADELLTGVIFYFPDGRIVASLPGNPPPLDETRAEISLAGQSFALAYQALADGQGRPFATLAAAVSEKRLVEAKSQAWRTVAFGVASAIVFSLALATLLMRRITRPIAQLHAGALAVAKGDLDQRITLQTQDEIGELASAFNQMTIAVRENRDELRRQIADRSNQLAEALMRLGEAQPSRLLTVGEVVAERYRVVGPLGIGGMGAVYEVERLSDGRRLALKQIKSTAGPGGLARLAREAQVAAQLDHPNLVGIVDVSVSQAGSLFLVMELVEGCSLEDERERFGNGEWARPLLRQVAVGLEALHLHGIVHRDLKPANVLVADGCIKIADFGLARWIEAADGLAETQTMGAIDQLTRTGIIMGTPRYMAPELAVGAAQAKPSSDVFSFGVMACEMLTGQQPFPEPAAAALIAGRSLPARSIATLPPLIERCLGQDPATRPSAADLVKFLSG